MIGGNESFGTLVVIWCEYRPLILALDSEIGIAVLTNINDSSANDAIYEIEDILYGAIINGID